MNVILTLTRYVGGKLSKPFPDGSKLGSDLKNILCEGISVNSTASLVEGTGEVEIIRMLAP
jgi:hypothetical protein